MVEKGTVGHGEPRSDDSNNKSRNERAGYLRPSQAIALAASARIDLPVDRNHIPAMRTVLALLLLLSMLVPLGAGHAAMSNSAHHEAGQISHDCADAASTDGNHMGGHSAHPSMSCDAEPELVSCCPAAICGAAARTVDDRWDVASHEGVGSRIFFPTGDAPGGLDHSFDPPPPRA